MVRKTSHKRIPSSVYGRVVRLGELFDMPTTKAFIIQDKFLLGDFKARKVKKTGTKTIFEIEFNIPK